MRRNATKSNRSSSTEDTRGMRREPRRCGRSYARRSGSRGGGNVGQLHPFPLLRHPPRHTLSISPAQATSSSTPSFPPAQDRNARWCTPPAGRALALEDSTRIRPLRRRRRRRLDGGARWRDRPLPKFEPASEMRLTPESGLRHRKVNLARFAASLSLLCPNNCFLPTFSSLLSLSHMRASTSGPGCGFRPKADAEPR